MASKGRFRVLLQHPSYHPSFCAFWHPQTRHSSTASPTYQQLLYQHISNFTTNLKATLPLTCQHTHGTRRSPLLLRLLPLLFAQPMLPLLIFLSLRLVPSNTALLDSLFCISADVLLTYQQPYYQHISNLTTNISATLLLTYQQSYYNISATLLLTYQQPYY